MQQSTREILLRGIDSKQVSAPSEGTENSFTHPCEEQIVEQMHSSDDKTKKFFEKTTKNVRVGTQQSARKILPYRIYLKQFSAILRRNKKFIYSSFNFS